MALENTELAKMKRELGSESISADFHKSVNPLFVQLSLAQATQLARRGRYPEAESLVLGLMKRQNLPPAALDLLARIHAQQGRFVDAAIFWKEALQIDSSNEAYNAGLLRIANIQARLTLMSSIGRFARAFTVLIFLAMGIWGIKHYLIDLKVESAVAKVLDEAKRQGIIPYQAAPDIKLAVLGVSLTTRKDDVVLTFDSGLFVGGARLKPEGKAVLLNLGKQLEPYVNSISLNITGHTNNLPLGPGSGYRDNVTLGMARAIAVFDYLRQASRLPWAALYVQSLGEVLAPYPNDTAENRAKNQTVSIRIAEIKK